MSNISPENLKILAAARKKIKLKGYEAAELLEVSRSHYSEMENGKAAINDELIEKIREKFKLPDWPFGEVESDKKEKTANLAASREDIPVWHELVARAREKGSDFLDDIERAVNESDKLRAAHLLAAFRVAWPELNQGEGRFASKEFPSAEG